MFNQTEISGDLTKYALLILAAGSSSRMGTSKQLLIVDQKPLLLKTVEVALASNVGNVVVVLGANETDHRKILEDVNVDIVFHADWKLGMGSSLKAGIKFIIDQYSNLAGVLVMVCDQPFLASNHLIRLAEVHRDGQKVIVASSYAGILGVPCLLSSKIIPRIFELNDDEGAKNLIKEFGKEVDSVCFPKGEIDLDTPEDLLKIN